MNKTPTPWEVARCDNGNNELVSYEEPHDIRCSYRHIATFERLGDLERAAECVNACVGIENPATEIQQMRDALKQGYDALKAFTDDSSDPGTGALSALYMMRAAIGLTGLSDRCSRPDKP